jgi:hypothetical protein
MHERSPELSMPTDEQVHLAVESFRMLADPTRVKHVWALLAEALFHAEHTDRGLPENTEHRHQSSPTQPASTSLRRSDDGEGTKHLTGGSFENDPAPKHVVATSVKPSGGYGR